MQLRASSFVISCVLIMGASACSKKVANSEPFPDRVKPPTKSVTSKMPDQAVSVELLGVSEKVFIALHQHKEGTPPVLHGEMIEVGGEKAYLSLPQGEAAPMPGVIVIQEWWGLNDNIKHWADRLAAEGYAALAIDLYEGKVTKKPEEAMKYIKGVSKEKTLATLKAAHKFLVEDPRVKARKTASIGWCFGGGWSLQLALNEPELDGAVIYYGRLVTEASELKRIKAKILGNFGNLDQGIPPEQVARFEKGLKEAGVSATINRFEANHGFGNPSSARYEEKAASEAWERSRKFLADVLK